MKLYIYHDGLEKEIDVRNKNEEALISECEKIKEQLEKQKIVFKVKTGKEGKMFGSISTKQIADELNKKGFNIDKKKIKSDITIDSLGVHNVEVELHKKVIVTLKIEVKEV